MGFLDKLRGGGDITLDVRLEPAEVGPGDEVTVHFDLGGELDDKCRDVRVGVTGVGNYLIRERYQDSDGDWQTRESWRTLELFEEEHHYPVKPGPGKATFTIPENAPPASSEAVTWTGFARVDRQRGRDKVERRDIAVRHSAEGLPTDRAPQRYEDGLTLDDVPTAVRAGDTLTGHLTINVAKDVSVTATRIRLHRKVTYIETAVSNVSVFGDGALGFFEFVGSSSNITRSNKVAEVDLSGKREFSAGTIEQVPFSITVPATAGPTTAHAYARVEWRLEAVLDRRMRDDLSVTTPLIVF